MEFNSSGFFAAVCVDVFDFYDLGYVLYDFDQSVYLVDLDHIDEFLLEEFG